MAKKKTSKTEKPKVNRELEGFDIQVNSFGEIITSYDVNKINDFLNRNVDDKKLRDRDDLFEDSEAKEADEDSNEEKEKKPKAKLRKKNSKE